MSLLRTVLREALGLFVDDGSLAAGVLGAVVAVALLLRLGVDPGAAGWVLVVALLLVLLENVWRFARKRRPSPR